MSGRIRAFLAALALVIGLPAAAQAASTYVSSLTALSSPSLTDTYYVCQTNTCGLGAIGDRESALQILSLLSASSPLSYNGSTATLSLGTVPYTNLPSLSANQLLGALTGTTPSGLSVPSCAASNDALTWTSGTGFGCNTIAGSGSPGGTSGQIQYNNSGAFGGLTPSGGFTIVPSTGVVTLGNPGPSTLGGIESLASTSHEWINAISTAGVPSATQPAFTDLSGSASAAQMSTNLGAAVSTLCSASTTNFVRGDGTCVAPSGGAVSLTAATPNLVFTPSPITGAGTIGFTAPTTDQSAAGTAIITGYNTETVYVGGGFTYTLAQAGTTGFGSGWGTCLLNVSTSGSATLTTTTSTFKGAGNTSSLTIAPGAWACPTSDGTNYGTATSGGGGGSGTVTSVGMTVPSFQSVSGSPITGAGTLAVTDNTQTANTVFAGPASGSAAAPTFRAIVPADQVPSAIVSLTDGTTITPNNPVGRGSIYTLSLTATGHTMAFPASAVAGQSMLFEITSASGYTFSWNSSYSFASGTPVLSTTAINIISCSVVTGGTNAYCVGPTAVVVNPSLATATGATPITVAATNMLTTVISMATPTASVVNLPGAAVQAAGFRECVKDGTTNFAANNATVKSPISGTIDGVAGSTGIVMNQTHEYLCFQSDGTNWWVE